MGLPRYRHQSIGDLQSLVLEPLIRDRIALAHTADPKNGTPQDVSGIVFWASVSEEVDAKIREQIKSGSFPVKPKPEDWTSGKINWMLDIIAPNAKVTGRVIANFKQAVKEGELRLHPVVARMPDKETLEKMGAVAAPEGT